MKIKSCSEDDKWSSSWPFAVCRLELTFVFCAGSDSNSERGCCESQTSAGFHSVIHYIPWCASLCWLQETHSSWRGHAYSLTLSDCSACSLSTTYVGCTKNPSNPSVVSEPVAPMHNQSSIRIITARSDWKLKYGFERKKRSVCVCVSKYSAA